MGGVLSRLTRWLSKCPNRLESAHVNAAGRASDNKDHLSNGAIAVLVDFDNAVLSASDASYTLSFRRLRDYCRSFGRVAFADIFLSPRIIKDLPSTEVASSTRLFNALNNAGFRVVVCPLGTKDRDQVDSYVKSAGLAYARDSSVSRIVVVSEDSDFKDPNFVHPIRDLEKELILLRPSELGAALSEVDGLGGILLPSVKKREFGRIIDLVGSDPSALPAETATALSFARDVIVAVADLTVSERSELPFKHIVNLTYRRIPAKWRSNFNLEDVRAVVSTLVDGEILRAHKKEIGGITIWRYYRLDRTHLIAAHVLAERFREFRV